MEVNLGLVPSPRQNTQPLQHITPDFARSTRPFDSAIMTRSHAKNSHS